MKAKLLGAMMSFVAGAMPAMATAPCHQKQVAEVVYPAVQQVQVVVPVYGIIPYPAAYYAPSPLLSPTVAPEESRLDRIEKLMLQMLEQKAPQALPLTQSKTASCVACHSGKKDVPQIDFTKLSPEMKALSIERVLDGSMPPKSKLSKEDRRAVNAELLK